MMEELKMPIVWIDSDAEIMSYPTLFDTLRRSYDIAVYHRNRPSRENELLSGTVYFNYTLESMNVINRWIDVTKRKYNVWDQKNLQMAIETYDGNLKVFELPCSYVRIFDAKDQNEDPIILHHQASRTLKKVVNVT
jgi:hypothetical protein